MSRCVVWPGQRPTKFLDLRREGRTGTLWESRYKSSPMDTDAYLLASIRYIELSPVRARMVEATEAYCWSSARHHLDIERCNWLDEDPCYRALSDDAALPPPRYRDLLQAAIPDDASNIVPRGDRGEKSQAK